VAVRAVDAMPGDSLAPPERVGRRLTTSWVLWGSVFAERESIRVVLHLVQVNDDRGAWVGSFLGPLTGSDALGEEMARAVSSQLPMSVATGPSEPYSPFDCNEARVVH